VGGSYDVDEQDKVSRTVAIDPMRKIAFAMAGRADANGVPDPNAASPDKPSNQESSSKGQTPREQPTNERRTNERTSTPTRSR
jgi:hypothetical protein